MSCEQIALLVGDNTVFRWQAQALEKAFQEVDVELTLVVNNPGTGTEEDSGSDTGGLTSTANQLLHYLSPNNVGELVYIDRELWEPDVRAYREQVDLEAVEIPEPDETLDIEPVPAEGIGVKLPEPDAEYIADRADTVIRFDYGILKGDILTLPENGVLSYHHGDIREYRGIPPGFWEFINGDATAGVTLQQLTEVLDGGRIVTVETIDITDKLTLGEVLAALYEKSVDMLADGLAALDDDSFSPIEPEETGEYYSLPGWPAMTKYILINNFGRLRRTIT